MYSASASIWDCDFKMQSMIHLLVNLGSHQSERNVVVRFTPFSSAKIAGCTLYLFDLLSSLQSRRSFRGPHESQATENP